MVVLAHLQGVAATFRVGRHHHPGPLHEGRGLTHALTHDAPTDLTVAAALVRKASSRRRRSRLWPKPVNLRTWSLVSDSIVMVQALAELRYGVVAYTRAKQCEKWAQFQPNPLRYTFVVSLVRHRTTRNRLHALYSRYSAHSRIVVGLPTETYSERAI